MGSVYKLIADSLEESFQQSLLEMACTKSVAIDKLDALSLPYSNPVLKCTLYQNSTGNLHHWCREIAEYLYKASNIKLRSSNKCPSSQLYRDYLLLGVGDSLKEYKDTLEVFQSRNSKYPQPALTTELVQKIQQVFMDLADYFAPILERDEQHPKEWFRQKLKDYFEDM